MPGACDEEPPGIGSDPWSTTVMSSHPRSDSSSAMAAPTTPAPMMTTVGPDIRRSFDCHWAGVHDSTAHNNALLDHRGVRVASPGVICEVPVTD